MIGFGFGRWAEEEGWGGGGGGRRQVQVTVGGDAGAEEAKGKANAMIFQGEYPTIICPLGPEPKTDAHRHPDHGSGVRSR